MFFPIIFFLLGANFVLAEEVTSSSYKVLDPVMFSANYSTSSSYGLHGTFFEMSLGTSSAASFKLNPGFLYFPYVSTPAVSATAGSGQVALTWSASEGFLGWTVSGYNVGQATVSGGPYTFTSSLGNVLSSTRTGLTNGTTYYFIIRAEDAFVNSIATSTEVSAIPVASPSPSPSPTPSPSPSSGGGGGGGGGGATSAETGVIFSGRAYPLSKVGILKDGQLVLTTIAGPDSNFSATINDLAQGNYNFSVYGEDKNSIRSSPFSFPIFITRGVVTKISGIFIAPTISVDKSEVKRGDDIAIFGQSANLSEVTVNVSSEEEFFVKTPVDKEGVYLLNFDTSVLDSGNHSAKSKSAVKGEVSSFSKIVNFLVGTKNVALTAKAKPVKGDLNNDGKVNLVDFSVAAFWYKRPLNTAFKATEAEKLNGDGKIDLIDFSIMAYHWTG